MSIVFAWHAVLFVGECFAGSTVILALAWLATRAARGRASLRHLIWLCAFGALLLLPVAALLVPPRAILASPVHAAMAPVTDSVASDATLPERREEAPAPVSAPTWHADMRDAAVGLFTAWVPGLFWIALQATTALFGLHVLRRDSVAYAPDCVALPDMQGRDWELRLATRAGACGPLTFGLRKPVVLLPRSAMLWPRERLEAVLLHELAHVRRRDSLTQLVAHAACALYWPNPMVWMAARALRREAEISADDAVLQSGVRPSAYAGALLELAVEFRRENGLTFAMAAPNALEARVTSLLAQTQSRSGVTKMDAFKIACLGVSATALLALARPTFADEVAPPPAPVAPLAPAAPPAPVAAAIPPVPPEPVRPVRPAHPMAPDRIEAAAQRARQQAEAAELRAEAARERAEEAAERARDLAADERAPEAPDQDREHHGDVTRESERTMDRDGIRETVRQSIRQADAQRAQILAQVRLQVHHAIAEAKVQRDAAMAQAEAEMKAAIAEAKAQAKAELARRHENWPTEN